VAKPYWLLLLAASLSSTAFAIGNHSALYSELGINPDRAKFNYQMLCQGCHTPDARGGRGVPNMNGQAGYFLNLPAGREYLVRVPGSAKSALNDERLTELLNLTLLEFAGSSLPLNWQPYQTQEVASARQQPLYEVLDHRQQLADRLRSLGYPVSD